MMDLEADEYLEEKAKDDEKEDKKDKKDD